jgi:hypothetical protein
VRDRDLGSAIKRRNARSPSRCPAGGLAHRNGSGEFGNLQDAIAGSRSWCRSALP